jgi:pseudouridine-5'-phosphate glycosidase
MHELIQFNDEIKHALKHKKPIIALESSVLSYGMPYPDSVNYWITIEQEIRCAGGVPATIAIYEGKILIGVDKNIMHQLTSSYDANSKASRRNLAYLLCNKKSAVTTVAATVFCAHLANIPIFVTGGIGAEHHLEEKHFDVSADLLELSTTPVTVICSGAKSILDLQKTLEILETQGVPVVGYQTEQFPAFQTHASGIALENRVETPEEVACLMAYQRQLNLNNGIIIANAIPKAAEIPDEQMRPIIKQAQYDTQNMLNKRITPRLLERVAQLTAEQHIHANIELIKNNALLGTQIAIAYQKHLKTKPVLMGSTNC